MKLLSMFIGSKISGYIALGAVTALALGGLYIWGLRAQLDVARAQRDEYKGNFAACKDNFSFNKKVSDAYFEQNNSLRDQLRADKRLLTDSCVSVPTSVGAYDPAPEGYVWKGQVSVADAFDYFAECGEVEIRLRELQDWICSVGGCEED